MMPTFIPNDRIIVSSIPYIFTKPKTGDAVIFRYNDEMLVKRIVKISNGKFFVGGDNKVDSVKTGTIEQADILGKVIKKL